MDLSISNTIYWYLIIWFWKKHTIRLLFRRGVHNYWHVCVWHEYLWNIICSSLHHDIIIVCIVWVMTKSETTIVVSDKMNNYLFLPFQSLSGKTKSLFVNNDETVGWNYSSISKLQRCKPVEVWKWICNLIPHFTRHVIIYPCWD